MDKAAAKEDGKDRGAAIGAGRTHGPPDADPGRDHAKDAPVTPEPEPEKVRERGFEMEL